MRRRVPGPRDETTGDLGLPAGTSRELLALVTQLWPGVAQGALRVAVRRPPGGWRCVEAFLVVPGLTRAQMLLPADPRVAARSLNHYRALREPRARTYRLAVAGALRLPVAGRRAFDTMTVCARVEDSTVHSELSAVHWVAQRLATGPLHAAIGLTNPGPNRKPILQLFDERGAPVGFVKVGWNALTATMVDNEARALRELDADGTTYPLRPRVLLHERWQGMSLLVTAPLPLDLRAVSSASRAPAGPYHRLGPDAAPTVSVSRLADSRYWQQVRARVDDVCGGVAAAEGQALRAHVDAVEANAGQLDVAFGRWHGDWVYWNMACQADRLWVWDWEHASSGAPVGFDAMHFTFQREFVRRRRSFAESVLTAAAAAGDVPGQRQLPAADDLVARTLYPLEIYLRAAGMHVLGAGWNPRLHEGAVAWLTTPRS